MECSLQKVAPTAVEVCDTLVTPMKGILPVHNKIMFLHSCVCLSTQTNKVKI